MNTNNTIENLVVFIQSLIDDAETDNSFDVAWFTDTEHEKFSIVGGWLESGFAAEDRDLFCLSKSNPSYVMAIKVVANEGPYAYCDFETLYMPIDDQGVVDDTLTILEWELNIEALAEFIYGEWERIMKDHG